MVRQAADASRIPFHLVLQGLTLSAWINTFLSIRFRGQVVKWKLFPLQRKLCEALESASRIRDTTFWLLKARQVGGTEIVAAWCLLKCMAIPGFRILVLSKTGGAAIKFIKNKVLPMLERLHKYAPDLPWPRYEVTLNVIRFFHPTGEVSVLEAVNSANHAGRGDTVDAVVMDEAGAGEFEHHAEDIFQSVSGTTEHGAGAFMVVMGTSAPGTWFNIQSEKYALTMTPEQALHLGIWFHFLPMDVFPWRNEKWWAKKVAKLGDVGARQEYPRAVADAFLSKQGLVFPMFEQPAGRHVQRRKLDWTWLYVVGYDHGRTVEHPAVLLHMLFNATANHLHVFKEQVWEGEGLEKICADINAWMADAKVKLSAPRPQLRIADTAITADDGRQTVRDIIHQRTKLYFQGAQKHNELVSLDHVVTRLNENRLTIDPGCTFTINQISHLLWDKAKSRFGKPVDLGNDTVDVLRYVCAELAGKHKRKQVEPAPLKPYDPKAREYRERNSITRPRAPAGGPGKSWQGY